MGLITTVTTSFTHDASRQPSLLVVADHLFATYALPPSGIVSIGRSPECDVCIDDVSVSRVHAELQLGESLVVIDKGSANGTWVLDRRLPPEQPTAVRVDQAIRLGSVTLLVQRRTVGIQPRRTHTHTYFEERLEDECAQALRHSRQLAILHVISDDTVALHDLLGSYLQDGDVVGSYSPSELEILLSGGDPGQTARVLTALAAALEPSGARLGSAHYPRDGRDANTLVAKARSRALGEIPEPVAWDEIVVVDERMAELHRLVGRVAAADISVLLQGETGVGKEVIAEALHRQSPRAQKPFLKLNCAGLGETLLESELFGHEKGAFTGATATKQGLLEVAEGGTVFLDEIAELSPGVQAKLLRVLEERKLLRVGGLTPRSIDLRIVSATNRDLEAEVARGAFRLDLLYRLNAISIVIPPLRERVAEIVPLAYKFLAAIAEKLDQPVPRLTEDVCAVLQAYTWPGNVRELRNVLERALVLADDVIDARHLPAERMRAPFRAKPQPKQPLEYDPELDAEERRRIIEALEVCSGNQTHAAKLLGIARRTLINKIERFSLPRPRKPKA